MAGMVTIDLAEEEDIIITAGKGIAEETSGGLLASADAQVEIAYGDSTIVMPLSVKTMWDEWVASK